MPNTEDTVQVSIAAALLAENLAFDTSLIAPEPAPPIGRTRIWHLRFTLPPDEVRTADIYLIGKADILGAFITLKLVKALDDILVQVTDLINQRPFAKLVRDPNNPKQALVRADFPVDSHSNDPITFQTVASAWRSVLTATSDLIERFPGRFEPVAGITTLPWMRVSSTSSPAAEQTAESER